MDIYGKDSLHVNEGWRQGFYTEMEPVSPVYYRLVITSPDPSNPVQVHIGSVGVRTHGDVLEHGYMYMDGTSMAVPHISGMAVMIHAAAPELTAPEIKSLILETVNPVPALEMRLITGGRVNLSATLNRIASSQNLPLSLG